MFLNDGVRHGQPKPRAEPHLFRREKWIENLAQDVCGNPWAAVGDFERDGVTLDIEPGSNDEMAASRSPRASPARRSSGG